MEQAGNLLRNIHAVVEVVELIAHLRKQNPDFIRTPAKVARVQSEAVAFNALVHRQTADAADLFHLGIVRPRAEREL